jgi:hypothetical protein
VHLNSAIGTLLMARMILDPVGALNHGSELLFIAMATPAFGHGYPIQAWRSMAEAWRKHGESMEKRETKLP